MIEKAREPVASVGGALSRAPLQPASDCSIRYERVGDHELRIGLRRNEWSAAINVISVGEAPNIRRQCLEHGNVVALEFTGEAARAVFGTDMRYAVSLEAYDPFVSTVIRMSRESPEASVHMVVEEVMKNVSAPADSGSTDMYTEQARNFILFAEAFRQGFMWVTSRQRPAAP